MVDDTGLTQPRPPARPRWLKMLAIAAAAAVVVFVIVALMTGGGHGPGRHLPGGEESPGHTPPVQHTP